MAEAFREITEWKDSTPTGVYLLEGDKALAFCNFRGEVTYFTKPLQIDKRGRKFERVQNLFEVEPDTSHLVKVAGSKGAVYYVDSIEKTCTCPGFTFRGKCKHLDSLEK